MDDKERARRDLIIQEFLADEGVRDLAFDMAQRAREYDDPEIFDMDVSAAEKYARVCCMKMTASEFVRLSTRTVASLWARGAVGSARYRRARRKKV